MNESFRILHHFEMFLLAVLTFLKNQIAKQNIRLKPTRSLASSKKRISLYDY